MKRTIRKRGKHWFLLFIMILTAVIIGCSTADRLIDDQNSDIHSTVDSSDYSESVAQSAATYDEADLVANSSFIYTVYLDFDQNTVRLSTGSAQTISTAGTSVLDDGTDTVTVTAESTGITLESAGSSAIQYVLSGHLSGALTVDSESGCQLYMENVTITGSGTPALVLVSSAKVFLVTDPGSENTLTDDSDRDADMTMKAALYGKGPMIFSGSGELTVNGNYKHGIYSADYIRVCEGTLEVNVSARDAIRSVNGFIFDDGDLTITGTGTTMDDESKGIKVEGSEDNPGEGFIVINGGTLDITTVSKAVTASWDADDDAETSYTSDDPNPYVEINNGIIRIITTGSSYELSTGESCSPEGIEGKSSLTVNSGYITIATDDDCLNAGDSIEINGGYIYAVSSSNDAIDSNGILTINGGVICAAGSDSPEEAFDCDNNTFTITGGILVGISGATSKPTASVCTQNSVILQAGGSQGESMALETSEGTVVFGFIPSRDFDTMLLSSPEISTGTSYTVITGGTVSGSEQFYGLFLDALSCTGGSKDTGFTVSSAATYVK